MWIHLPSQCFPSVQESEDWSLELGSFSQTLARFASSRGTFRQPKHWRDAWTTGRLTPLRFGPTLPDSTVSGGLDRWILSWAGYRASRSAWPASAKARTMSDGSGPTSGAGFGTYDRDSSSWRTFPDLFGMDYPVSLETWPKRGSLRSGVVSARRMWERPIVESGSSSWPTPVSNDDNKTPEAHMAMKRRMKGGPRNTITSLQVMAQTWPSPRAEDSEATGAHRGTPDTLTAATKQWQTPTVGGGGQQCDLIPHRGHFLRPSGKKATLYLEQQAAQWATPRSSPQENRATRIYGTNTGIKHAEGLAQQAGSFRPDRGIVRGGQRTPSGVVLNPRFVEALMGLPDGWTGLAPIETTAYMRWEMLSSLSVRRWLSPRSTKVYWGVGPGKEKASA